MELDLRRGAADDHLMVALFIAALLHGLVILGVRFSAPPQTDPLPTLEVLLVPAGPNQEANLDASYMAERNQDGGGTTTDRVRTSLPEPTPDLRSDARRSDRRRHRRHPGERGPARERRPCPPARSTRAGRSRATKACRRRAPRRRSTCGPCHRSAVGAVATADELALRGRTLSDDRLLADTRESQIAGYLDGWKRRIERVGTLNFPNEARRRSLSGNPVLEVAIGANGTLQQVLVRRSSGYSELDHAAMNIVRLASPFDPFPSAMRDSYPVLRFAYEWQFLRGHLGSGAVLTEEP